MQLFERKNDRFSRDFEKSDHFTLMEPAPSDDEVRLFRADFLRKDYLANW